MEISNRSGHRSCCRNIYYKLLITGKEVFIVIIVVVVVVVIIVVVIIVGVNKLLSGNINIEVESVVVLIARR